MPTTPRIAIRLTRLAVVGLAMTACGAHGPAGSSVSATAPASAAPMTPSDPAASSDTPLPAATTASGPHRCHTNQVAVQFLPAQGATGHSFRSAALRNTAGGTCTVYGYVGMLLLDAAGRPLPTVVQRGGGMLGTPPPALVALRPMAIAYFEMEYSNMQSGPSPCPTSAQVEVTPPDETTHLLVDLPLAPCADGRLIVTALHDGAPRA
ncbi:MAG: DUF4232 domain-containing protein [Candidatus Dormibacteria bacterium]